LTFGRSFEQFGAVAKEICLGQKMRFLVQIAVNKANYLFPKIFILKPKLTNIIANK